MPLKANSIENKIKILKLIKKTLKEDKDYYFPEEQMSIHPGICSIVLTLADEEKIHRFYKLYTLGLKKPKVVYPIIGGEFWFPKWEKKPRIKLINDTMKCLKARL